MTAQSDIKKQGDIKNLRTIQLETTRRSIETTAVGLFQEHGYESVTTGEIAAAAGISPRTFFRHFPGGKEEIMLAQARWTMQLIQRELLSRPPSEPPLVAIRQALLAGQRSPEFRDAAAAARVYSEIASRHEDLLARMLGEYSLQAQHLADHIALRLAVDPQTDIRPTLISQAVAAATTTAWLTWLKDLDQDYGAILDEALDLLEAGLAYAASRPAPLPGLEQAGGQRRTPATKARPRR